MLALGLVAICLAFLLPGHYAPWVSFQQQWVAALGAAIVGLGVVLHGGSTSTRWPMLAWVALATALVPLLQTMVGQIGFVSDGVLASLYLVGFALSVVAGASVVVARRAELLEGLCAALFVAALVSTGLALYQWLRLGASLYVVDLPPGARPFANLAQPNHLATLLALGVAALLHWYEGRRIGGWTAAVAVAWLGLGMLMTQSRTAWLFVVLTVIAWATFRRKARLRLPLVAVVGGALAFFLAVLLWGTVSDAMDVSSQALEGRLAAGPRTLLWPILVDAVRQAPWFGYGWNQVGLAQQAVALAHPRANYWFTDSHNLFLDLVLWNGLPLGLLFSGLLALWLYRQTRACTDPERWALLLAVSALFLHAMLEYPHDYTYFLLPIGLIMGMLDATDQSTRIQVLPRSALAVPLVLTMAMLGWIGVEYMRVEEAARQLRFVAARIGLDRVSAAPVPKVWLLDGLREGHRYAITEAHHDMSTAELGWMRKVAQHNASAPILLRYAVAAGLNGQSRQALNTLGILCKMNLPARCAEARAEWERLQLQHAELHGIPFPSDAAAASSLH